MRGRIGRKGSNPILSFRFLLVLVVLILGGTYLYLLKTVVLSGSSTSGTGSSEGKTRKERDEPPTLLAQPLSKGVSGVKEEVGMINHANEEEHPHTTKQHHHHRHKQHHDFYRDEGAGSSTRYSCVMFHRTENCNPYGPLIKHKQRRCSQEIRADEPNDEHGGISGFCECTDPLGKYLNNHPAAEAGQHDGEERVKGSMDTVFLARVGCKRTADFTCSEACARGGSFGLTLDAAEVEKRKKWEEEAPEREEEGKTLAPPPLRILNRDGTEQRAPHDHKDAQFGEKVPCVGFRATLNCNPFGSRDYDYDQECDAEIPNMVSGYCLCSEGVDSEGDHSIGKKRKSAGRGAAEHLSVNCIKKASANRQQVYGWTNCRERCQLKQELDTELEEKKQLRDQRHGRHGKESEGKDLRRGGRFNKAPHQDVEGGNIDAGDRKEEDGKKEEGEAGHHHAYDEIPRDHEHLLAKRREGKRHEKGENREGADNADDPEQKYPELYHKHKAGGLQLGGQAAEGKNDDDLSGRVVSHYIFATLLRDLDCEDPSPGGQFADERIIKPLAERLLSWLHLPFLQDPDPEGTSASVDSSSSRKQQQQKSLSSSSTFHLWLLTSNERPQTQRCAIAVKRLATKILVQKGQEQQKFSRLAAGVKNKGRDNAPELEVADDVPEVEPQEDGGVEQGARGEESQQQHSSQFQVVIKTVSSFDSAGDIAQAGMQRQGAQEADVGFDRERNNDEVDLDGILNHLREFKGLNNIGGGGGENEDEQQAGRRSNTKVWRRLHFNLIRDTTIQLKAAWSAQSRLLSETFEQFLMVTFGGGQTHPPRAAQEGRRGTEQQEAEEDEEFDVGPNETPSGGGKEKKILAFSWSEGFFDDRDEGKAIGSTSLGSVLHWTEVLQEAFLQRRPIVSVDPLFGYTAFHITPARSQRSRVALDLIARKDREKRELLHKKAVEAKLRHWKEEHKKLRGKKSKLEFEAEEAEAQADPDRLFVDEVSARVWDAYVPLEVTCNIHQLGDDGGDENGQPPQHPIYGGDEENQISDPKVQRRLRIIRKKIRSIVQARQLDFESNPLAIVKSAEDFDRMINQPKELQYTTILSLFRENSIVGLDVVDSVNQQQNHEDGAGGQGGGGSSSALHCGIFVRDQWMFQHPSFTPFEGGNHGSPTGGGGTNLNDDQLENKRHRRVWQFVAAKQKKSIIDQRKAETDVDPAFADPQDNGGEQLTDTSEIWARHVSRFTLAGSPLASIFEQDMEYFVEQHQKLAKEGLLDTTDG